MAANFVVSVTLLTTTELGTAALTLASSLASVANAYLLAARCRRYAAPHGGIAGAWARSLAAGGAMCAVVPFVQVSADGDGLLSRALGDVGLPVAAGIAVYVAAHVLMRSPEIRGGG